jgi:hypothetical protein
MADDNSSIDTFSFDLMPSDGDSITTCNLLESDDDVSASKPFQSKPKGQPFVEQMVQGIKK